MDRAAELFRQMEARFIEVAWMWAEVQQLVTQERIMAKRLNVHIVVNVTDAENGEAFTSTDHTYHAVPYVALVAMQKIGMKAMNDLTSLGEAAAKAKK